MNREVLPQRPLDPIGELVRLAPPETSSKIHIEATLDYIEAKMDRWNAEQDRRLKRAELRIRLCALLHGAATVFDLNPDGSRIQRHYSWCPFEAWMGWDQPGDPFGH